MSRLLKHGDRVVWLGARHDPEFTNHRFYGRTAKVRGASTGHRNVVFDDDPGVVRTVSERNLQKLREDEDAQVLGG